jgi:hypothetical protein
MSQPNHDPRYSHRRGNHDRALGLAFMPNGLEFGLHPIAKMPPLPQYKVRTRADGDEAGF